MTSATLAPPAAHAAGRREAAPPRAPRATLLVAGLALVTLHLLDLALSRLNIALLAVLVIVAVTLGPLVAQPHAMRPTRLAQPIPSNYAPSASAPGRNGESDGHSNRLGDRDAADPDCSFLWRSECQRRTARHGRSGR